LTEPIKEETAMYAAPADIEDAMIDKPRTKVVDIGDIPWSQLAGRMT
jgi:hypothetical protein